MVDRDVCTRASLASNFVRNKGSLEMVQFAVKQAVKKFVFSIS